MATTSVRRNPVLLGGLLVGVLDILAAFLVHGTNSGARPLVILQAIASGLLGPSAFRGGAATATLGLAVHFLIATVVAVVFVAASRLRPVLVRHAVPAGLAYGVVVYAVMNTVVLPLSRLAQRPQPVRLVVVMVVVHMLCVGLPAALVARSAARDRD